MAKRPRTIESPATAIGERLVAEAQKDADNIKAALRNNIGIVVDHMKTLSPEDRHALLVATVAGGLAMGMSLDDLPGNVSVGHKLLKEYEAFEPLLQKLPDTEN